METTQMNTPRKEEVTIKFGKGLVGKPFTTKNGKAGQPRARRQVR